MITLMTPRPESVKNVVIEVATGSWSEDIDSNDTQSWLDTRLIATITPTQVGNRIIALASFIGQANRATGQSSFYRQSRWRLKAGTSILAPEIWAGRNFPQVQGNIGTSYDAVSITSDIIISSLSPITFTLQFRSISTAVIVYLRSDLASMMVLQEVLP